MIRTLHHTPFEIIHHAFVEAFSDYVVPMRPTAEALREMCTRRAWVPELSSGLFEGEQLVAFTLNAIDGGVAYDTGSGVIPSHRRRGLARQTMQDSIELLRDAGAATYLLEVLEPNTGAIALYQGLGFVEARRLDCWTLGLEGSGSFGSRTIEEGWWDVQPSWQNSTASLARAHDEHVILGNDDGYVIVFPNTGDVPQLAVRPEARRRGLGTQLLRAAAAVAQKPLRLINVDARDAGIAAFLAALGAHRFVRQIEMQRALGV